MQEDTAECPQELLEGSYLARLGQADVIWREAGQHIPRHLRPRMRECVFLMLKPDAIQSGRYKTLLADMASAGWRLVHAQATITASQRHFEELYQYNLTIRNEQNMMCAWWLNARLYAMSPSIALMYWVSPEGALTAHQRVNRLKGSSNPFAGSPGELRWNAGGINLSLNLLHAADDPISSAREFLIFGTPGQLVSALQRAEALATGRPGAQALEDEALDEQVFLASPGHRGLDLPTVLTVAKSRLRATEPSSALRQATDKLYRRYRELAARQMDIKSRWATFCELSHLERELIDGLPPEQRNGDGSPGLLRHLAMPAEYDYQTAERLRVEFLRRKISLDPWDELALDTSLYYHDLFPQIL